ncbi:hypothetical protein EMEDMD4_790132 [Sinorhizobium medicae]|uniref:Uncharacterized protein n=1 Tax=Sinorhizobium medicae TaxID=110321 RepID=A0A508XAK9_9HYPH|nr:hypothetical protein EMEDMD4_790132 [Sinorhizobium medicae]
MSGLAVAASWVGFRTWTGAGAACGSFSITDWTAASDICFSEMDFLPNIIVAPLPRVRCLRSLNAKAEGYAFRFALEPALPGASAGESRSDSRESGGQAGADGRHHGDDHDRNQAGDQAVFNGGGAGFIASKTDEKIFHGSVLHELEKVPKPGSASQGRAGFCLVSRLLCGPYIDFVNPLDPFSLMADPAAQMARPVGLVRSPHTRFAGAWRCTRGGSRLPDAMRARPHQIER